MSDLEKRFPNYTPALKAIAMYHLTNKEYEEAITYYKRTLELRPDDIEAVVRLADCYTATSKFDDAIAVIKEAIAKSPDDTALKVALAYLYLYSW